jgi:hypothetical protein
MSNDKTRGLKGQLQDADQEERRAIIDGLPYDVGFGKPPRDTRFSSSNQPQRRSRRPKPPQGPVAVLEQELSARIEVTEGGKRRKLSKLRVGMRQFANRVATGDPKALALSLEVLRKSGHSSPGSLQRTALELEQARQSVQDKLDRLAESLKANSK